MVLIYLLITKKTQNFEIKNIFFLTFYSRDSEIKVNFGTASKIIYNKGYELECLSTNTLFSKELVLKRKGFYGKNQKPFLFLQKYFRSPQFLMTNLS